MSIEGLPDGWRRPLRRTAEPVQLNRPYAPPNTVYQEGPIPPRNPYPQWQPPAAVPFPAPVPSAAAPPVAGQAAGAMAAPTNMLPGQRRGEQPFTLLSQAPMPFGQAPTLPNQAPALPGQAVAPRSPWPVRATSENEGRVPILWCAGRDCSEGYVSVGAPGARSLRNRAVAAGWRYTPAGRLVCPACARRDSTRLARLARMTRALFSRPAQPPA